MPHKYILKSHFGPEKNFRIDYQADLTEEQLPIATAPGGPMLVIAGAGSGKTRTVTYRVAYLVESGVPLDRILLVTFTNKAAREMLSRVELLLKRDVKGIMGGTFHHVGNMMLRKNAKQVGYDPNRGSDASLILKTQFQANGYGLEWAEQLTAGLRTDTAATAGAFYDDGAGSAFGGQAWLQVTAFAGTSVTVTIEHCTTSGGTYAGVLAFSAVSAAPAWQRIAVSNTTAIDRYLQVVTTGTFTNAVFSVVFQRFTVAGVTF